MCNNKKNTNRYHWQLLQISTAFYPAHQQTRRRIDQEVWTRRFEVMSRSQRRGCNTINLFSHLKLIIAFRMRNPTWRNMRWNMQAHQSAPSPSTFPSPFSTLQLFSPSLVLKRTREPPTNHAPQLPLIPPNMCTIPPGTAASPSA